MTVVFRVFDDGVGFRYEFPDQPQLRAGEHRRRADRVRDRRAGHGLVGSRRRMESRGISLSTGRRSSEVGTAQTPLTIRTDSGLHIVDSTKRRWSTIRRCGCGASSGTRLKAVLSPSSHGPKVSRDAPFATPWRVIMIAPDAAGALPVAQIILNLNEPNKLGDV